MLRKYTPNLTNVVDWGELVVDEDGTFEEGLVRIMDSWDQVLRSKIVRLVKVLWQYRGVEEATWEHEDTMCANYPLSCKLKMDLGKGKTSFYYSFMCESERKEKKESQDLPSKIYGVSSIEVRRAKNESSSHRRGLRVGTENARFFEDPNNEFVKSKVSSLRSVHEAS